MSELVEKVATKIQDYFSAADRAYGEHDLCARAAITAVAEWLDENYRSGCTLSCANILKQLEQPKGAAGDGR